MFMPAIPIKIKAKRKIMHKVIFLWVQSITGAVQGDPLQQAQAPNGSKLAIPFGQMSETEKFLYKNSWSM